MRILTRVGALTLAALLILLTLSACGKDKLPSTDTTAPQVSESTIPPVEQYTIVENGQSAFTIVRPELAGKGLTQATVALRREIKEKFDCELTIATDWARNPEDVPTDTFEILIGITNRAESVAAAEKLNSGDFLIEAVSPKRIVIIGYSEEATISAVNTFIAQYILPNESNTLLSIAEDERYAGAVFDKYASLRNVSSNLVSSPSIVTRAATVDDLNALSDAAPATVIVDFDDGKVAGVFLAEAMKKIAPNSMPAFRVETTEELDHLMLNIRSLSIKDYFIVSSSADILSAAVSADTNARGILDCTAMTAPTEADLFTVRQTANRSFARVVLLSEAAATRANVNYLQKLLITVWVDGGGDDSTTELAQMITSGANGIVTQKRAELEAAFTKYFPAETIVRPFLVIGHRGMPSKAPENTIEGSLLAYDYGADIIENDIYLSKDGHVVVMHDASIDRTTNGTGKIEQMTLAQIKTYYVNKQFGTKYPTCEIPTLGEYCEAFKDNDAHIFIEIKSKNVAIVPKMVDVLKKYNFENRVSVITFNEDIMQVCKKLCPEISVGYLVSNYSDPTKPDESIQKVTEQMGKAHTTFNPNYASIDETILVALQQRGITLWPWTLNDASAYYSYILMGANGVTTNYANYSAEMFRGINAEQYSYTAKVGETVSPKLTLDRYDRKEEAINSANLKLVILEGEDIARVDGAAVTPTGAGKISFIYTYSDKTMLRQEYHVVSQPITINVN